MKTPILVFCSAACAVHVSQAATLATANFDADSYLFVGTNNAFDPQITLGESLRPSGLHFNWGVVTFDVSSLSNVGSKYLQLTAVQFVTLTGGSGGIPTSQVSSTGSADVQLVALGENYNDYLASADKATWFDTHVQNGSVPVIGTFNFNNMGSRHVDVTSVVNDWIDGNTTNHGFALFSTSGNVELASATFATESSRPALVDAVPEPSSSALLGAACISFLLRRKR